ncbi:hypothetical protein [uncultured Oscillibacter sp.]|uniref:hypothetical protein n=1 Tax=uncultured Oscillibacter sp. TaxID=876091 RepID=UPI0025D0233B|nr:hypothetical protein [uncultured Oscillibacter sp.]
MSSFRKLSNLFKSTVPEKNNGIMELKAKLFHQGLVGLTWKFHASPKFCANPEYYNRYIQLNAIEDCRRGMGVTHALVGEEKIELQDLLLCEQLLS